MALTFPPIYLLKFHLERDPEELHRLEEAIHVVWDIREAKLVLGIVKSKSRATLELRKLGLDTEEVVKVQKHGAEGGQAKARNPHSNKRRKIDSITIDEKEVVALDSETASEPDTGNEDSFQRKRTAARGSSPAKSSPLGKDRYHLLDSQVNLVARPSRCCLLLGIPILSTPASYSPSMTTWSTRVGSSRQVFRRGRTRLSCQQKSSLVAKSKFPPQLSATPGMALGNLDNNPDTAVANLLSSYMKPHPKMKLILNSHQFLNICTLSIPVSAQLHCIALTKDFFLNSASSSRRGL